jgi:hypothetical protein
VGQRLSCPTQRKDVFRDDFSVVLHVWQFSDITQLRHPTNTSGESSSPVAFQLDYELGKVKSVRRIYAAYLAISKTQFSEDQEGIRKASIFALGCRPSINSESTSPVPGACDMPHAP